MSNLPFLVRVASCGALYLGSAGAQVQFTEQAGSAGLMYSQLTSAPASGSGPARAARPRRAR